MVAVTTDPSLHSLLKLNNYTVEAGIDFNLIYLNTDLLHSILTMEDAYDVYVEEH
jgi:hypothetical protein